MRFFSRLVVAVAFVLALVVSTVPAQAQPRDFGSSFATIDASWLEAALNWLGGLLGGGDAAPLKGVEASGSTTRPTNPGGPETMGGSCIDPFGGCDFSG